MLEELETFLRVREAGSFSAAAHHSGEAVSTVTRRINRLEEELGAELFVRSTHHLRLTDDGTRLLPRAEELLESADRLRRAFGASGLRAGRPLRVSCFQTFGERVLLPTVRDFLLRNPQMQIDVDLENRPVDLVREGVDLAVRIGKPKDAALKMRRLVRHDMVAVAAPRYLRERGTPEHPRDLADHNCLTLRSSSAKTRWFFRRGETVHKVEVGGNLRSLGGGPLIFAARQGLGITVMTRWAVAEQLADGTLEELLPQYEVGLRLNGREEVYALFPEARSHPARGAFLDELVRRASRTVF